MKPKSILMSTIVILGLLFPASEAFSRGTSAAHFIAPIAICLPACTASVPKLFLQKSSVNNGMGWTAFSNLSAPDLGPHGDVVGFVRGEKQPPPISDACITVNNEVGITLQILRDVFVSTTLFKHDKIFNDNGTVRSWRVLFPVLDKSCDNPCTNPPNCACPPGGQGGINERFHVAKCADVLITNVVTDIGHEGLVVGGIECLDCDNFYANYEVTPVSHDFGSVNVETFSRPESFTITNTGTADLRIDSVVLTDTITGLSSKEFRKQNDNCTGQLILPSSSCKLQAIFSPSSAGQKNAILSIASNSRYSPSNVPFIGAGIIPIYSLSVRDISGAGRVSAMNMNCPPHCSENYHSGTNVVLRATPDAGWYFDSWGGDIFGNLNPYSLFMNSDKNITATFRKVDTGGDGTEDAKQHTDEHSNFVYNLTVGGGKYPVHVGSVSASDDNTNLTVTYAIDTGDWEFSETHVHVATSVEGIPKRQNGCLDPANFTHSASPGSPYTSQTYSIPISSILGDGPAPGGYTIYIAAEAVIKRKNDKGSKQTAWGEDRSFPCEKWSSYISYPLNISP